MKTRDESLKTNTVRCLDKLEVCLNEIREDFETEDIITNPEELQKLKGPYAFDNLTMEIFQEILKRSRK